MKLLFLLLSLLFPPLAVPSSADGALASERPDRLTLAFYYPWYAAPNGASGSESWQHWENVDESAHTISSTVNFPELGAYDSMDVSVVAQHCAWAADAGIDALIVSWWGVGSLTDRAMPVILEQALAHGLKVALYVEQVPRAGGQLGNRATADATADELLHLSETYGQHSAYLKLDTRPVIFTYVRLNQQLSNNGWERVFERLEGSPHRPAIIGDRPPEPIAPHFDGWHTYDPMGRIYHDWSKPQADTPEAEREPLAAFADRLFAEWLTRAAATGGKDGGGGVRCVSICPGYDERYFRPAQVYVDRDGGQTYRTLWERAIAADPDWILITSFNEWHEGSEIEPSLQNGHRALQTTGEMTKKWAQALDQNQNQNQDQAQDRLQEQTQD